MDERNKPRIIAAAITLLLAVITVAWLILCSLDAAGKAKREWPPEKHSEIILDEIDEEQFVPLYAAAGDNLLEPVQDDGPGASDTQSDTPTNLANDITDEAASEGVNTNLTTSETPSPASKPKTEKPGNSRPKESEEAARTKRQQRAAKNISDRLDNRFSRQGKKNGTVNETETDGNKASEGSSAGSGVSMTASVDQRPNSSKLGTIMIRCTVLPDGSVSPNSVHINVAGCSGKAGADDGLRAKCVEAAKKCRFARIAGKSDNRDGTIIFRWE